MEEKIKLKPVDGKSLYFLWGENTCAKIQFECPFYNYNPDGLIIFRLVLWKFCVGLVRLDIENVLENSLSVIDAYEKGK